MSTKKSTTELDLVTLQLESQARMVAYMATRKSHGKVKVKELNAMKRVRDAILGDCDIDMKTGAVAWEDGAVTFSDAEDFGIFVRAIEKSLGDDGEGVEFDLIDGAVDLLSAIESERSRQHMQREALKAANAEPAEGPTE